MQDIINFDIFMKYLANEEKQLLMTYLPSIDTVRSPERFFPLVKINLSLLSCNLKLHYFCNCLVLFLNVQPQNHV